MGRKHSISIIENDILQINIGKNLFKPLITREKGTLKLLKFPEDEEFLRTKSVNVKNEELPNVIKFMQRHLLSTMYGFDGVGIGSMQVGAPIRAFIVDIPKSKIATNNNPINFGDNTYLLNKLNNGLSVIIREHYFVYNGVNLASKLKILKKIPIIKDVNGKKQLVKIEVKTIQDERIDPDLIIERKPYFFINPRLKLDYNTKFILSEASPTVPMDIIQKHYNGVSDVKRPCNVEVEFINANLEKQVMKINGERNDYWKWFSRCVQHENDYLDGILFIDKIERTNN